MSSQSALIIGATGAVGKHLLTELLSSPNFTRVGEYGRRVTPIEKITAGKEKLEQKTIDFEKLEESGLNNGKWDVVFVTLGTSRANAGSAAAFEKIDREYVINAARAARSSDLSTQRIVYLSSTGANPSSSFLYPKSKGLTEVALSELGYGETIIFRPAFLKGAERAESRVAEKIFGLVTPFIPNAEIHVPVLAKSIRIAGQLGVAALPLVAEAWKEKSFTVIGNKGAVALAKTEA